MKKTLAYLFAATFTGIANAQSLSNALNEIRNENLIPAKQELIAVYNKDKQALAAFYLGNVYLKLSTLDSARYYYEIAQNGSEPMMQIAKARIAQLSGQGLEQYKVHIDKAISDSRRRDAEIYFQAGLLAYKPQAHQVSDFVSYVETAVRMQPENDFYGLTLGDMYLEMNEGGRAMSKYEDALMLDSNNVLANIRIGRLYYAAKNYPSAISFLEKANRINPSFSIAHKELGELYYLTRQYEKAAPEFKKYIELNYNDSRAKGTYGAFLYQLKEYQKAVDEVGVFLKSDTGNYIYHRIMAFSLFELRQGMEAQASMDRFWKYAPADKVSGLDYSYAGKIAASNGDTANAIRFFKSSVAADSSNAELQSEYAKALFNAKRYSESIEAYKRRLQMDKPASALDYYWLGRVYYTAGDYTNADTTFASFVAMQPKSPDGYLWRAKSRLELEDKTNLKGLSNEFYLKFIELGSTDINRNKSSLIGAYTYLAYVALSAKDTENAAVYFSKILELEPENKNAADELKKLKK